jgi:hypothetical protein
MKKLLFTLLILLSFFNISHADELKFYNAVLGKSIMECDILRDVDYFTPYSFKYNIKINNEPQYFAILVVSEKCTRPTECPIMAVIAEYSSAYYPILLEKMSKKYGSPAVTNKEILKNGKSQYLNIWRVGPHSIALYNTTGKDTGAIIYAHKNYKK